jgi:hypothetical protein
MPQPVFETPPTRVSELLSLTGNLDRGLDRIWSKHSIQPGGACAVRVFCCCLQEGLKDIRHAADVSVDLPVNLVEVLLGRVRICEVVSDHLPQDCALSEYFVGQCRRCKTVHWSKQ